MNVLRSIYGCIEAALLWYDLYSTKLKQMGFEINQYDKCVANKQIDGNQCTIIWYVDDNKVSHKDPRVVTKIINELQEYFGNFKITRGKEHELLGMKVKINTNGTVTFFMKNQIKKILEDFSEQISNQAKSPATKDLYTIDDN